MPKRNYTPEQIINSLREAEVLLSKGSTAAEAARHKLEMWRRDYNEFRPRSSLGNMTPSDFARSLSRGAG